MYVNVKKGFKYAVDGIHVRTFEPGPQEIPPDAGAFAVREGLAVEVEHKAVEASSENKGRKGRNK